MRALISRFLRGIFIVVFFVGAFCRDATYRDYHGCGTGG